MRQQRLLTQRTRSTPVIPPPPPPVQLRDLWSKPPQEEEHRRIMMPVKLECGAAQQVRVLAHAAERDRSIAEVRFQRREEGAAHLGADEALHQRITLGIIAANVH